MSRLGKIAKELERICPSPGVKVRKLSRRSTPLPRKVDPTTAMVEQIRADAKARREVRADARAEDAMVDRAAGEARGALRGLKSGAEVRAEAQRNYKLRTNAKNQKAFLRALSEVEKENPPGALLVVAEVRKRSKLSKEEFDQAALGLADKHGNGEPGGVVLHYHDWPSSLSEEDRAAMVQDGDTYFIGVARSQNDLRKVERRKRHGKVRRTRVRGGRP